MANRSEPTSAAMTHLRFQKKGGRTIRYRPRRRKNLVQVENLRHVGEALIAGKAMTGMREQSQKFSVKVGRSGERVSIFGRYEAVCGASNHAIAR